MVRFERHVDGSWTSRMYSNGGGTGSADIIRHRSGGTMEATYKRQAELGRVLNQAGLEATKYLQNCGSVMELQKVKKIFTDFITSWWEVAKDQIG
jgi:hypothetical protein